MPPSSRRKTLQRISDEQRALELSVQLPSKEHEILQRVLLLEEELKEAGRAETFHKALHRLYKLFKQRPRPLAERRSKERSRSAVKVLFLAANPKGTTTLALDEEVREITDRIRYAEHRDRLEIISHWAVRPDDLLQLLNQHRPHIVHFSGHGSTIDEIILLDRNGKPKPVNKTALASLFQNLKDNIRIVVLNACSSKAHAVAITRYIDCAIGMRGPIGDMAAVIFAASFYGALAFGRSVEQAFNQGTTALQLEGIAEHRTPQLLVRKGIRAREIVLF